MLTSETDRTYSTPPLKTESGRIRDFSTFDIYIYACILVTQTGGVKASELSVTPPLKTESGRIREFSTFDIYKC